LSREMFDQVGHATFDVAPNQQNRCASRQERVSG
jgi:hypothetical protein